MAWAAAMSPSILCECREGYPRRPEKNLAQIIDRQYPEEFKQMVIDIAEQALGKAKELTPVQTGRLRDAWNLGTIEKRGDTYYIEIYNNVEYAEPVEYGHRMKGGGFKKGAHMLEVSLQEMDRKLPDYLRAWLADFLNTHDLVYTVQIWQPSCHTSR